MEGGGSLVVNSGGKEFSATILSGGTATISSGGSATGDQIYGTLTIISTGATAVSNETVNSGGSLNISKSATVSNTTLISGGTVDFLTGAATLAGNLTFSGGDNTLLVGALANTVGTNGDLAAISGFSSTDKIDITALSGATATLSTVISGGNTIAEVISGGSTIVEEFVFSGTTTYTSSTLSLVANSGGHAEIEYGSAGSSGGTTTSVTTSTASGAYTETSGNTLLVLNGGSVSAATIDNGAFLVVSGGADYAATISAGGTETVSAGSATGDQIYGAASVDSGGDVSSETVEAGGVLVVNGGAVDTASTVLAGRFRDGAGLGNRRSDLRHTIGQCRHRGRHQRNRVQWRQPRRVPERRCRQRNDGVERRLSQHQRERRCERHDAEWWRHARIAIAQSYPFRHAELSLAATTRSRSAFSQAPAAAGSVTKRRSPDFRLPIEIDLTALTSAGTTLSVTTSGTDTVAEIISGGSAIVETFIFSGTTTYTSNTLSLVANSGGDAEIAYASGGGGTTTSVTTSTASGMYTETAGKTLEVLNGGSVTAPTIDSGAFLVVNGGVDSDADIEVGGTETVSAGTASGDQIYGSAVVSAGTMSNETVQSGGTLTMDGGTASNTVLERRRYA